MYKGGPVTDYKFPPELKDEIRDRIDIVAVIGESVRLKKSGANFMGLCPFHKEKSPSFSVNPNKKIFYCFGCHEGGDVFKFLMKRDNLGFGVVLEKLAVSAGVDVSRYERETPGGGVRLKRLHEANQVALAWFIDQLKASKGAQEYLKGRGVDGHTAKAFSLGYAPDGWNTCFEYLSSQGFTEEELVTTGLARRKEDTGRVYDYFRDRVVFPIHDDKGQVVAFGGRVLAADVKPKYLNSPETPVYSKGRILYNLHRIPTTTNGTLVLVEGYMDVVGLAQGGVTNAVATLGTALTEPHIRKLARVASTLYLAYDPDEAGVRATLRSLELLESSGITVKVLSLPDGLDPDELVLGRGKDAWSQVLANAAEVEDYLFDYTVKPFDLESLAQRREAVRQLQGVFRFLPSPTSRDRFLQRVTVRMKLDETVVRTTFVPEGPKRRYLTDESLTAKPVRREVTRISNSERHVLAYFLADGALLERHRAEIHLEDLEDPLVKRALEVLTGLPVQPGPISELLLSHVEEDAFSSFVAEIVANFETSDTRADDAVTESLGTLRKQRLEKRLRELKTLVMACRDSAEKKRLLNEQITVLRDLEPLRKAS
jgi:DNA primase